MRYADLSKFTGLSKFAGVIVASGVCLALATPAWSEGTFDIPKGATFSQEKLAGVAEYLNKEIASGKIPGAIVYIAQHGKPVYSGFFGVRGPANKVPMTADTIFRIHSMSKPVTSVAAMMLVQDGKIRLDDPLSKYIPAFANTQVGVEVKSEGQGTTLKAEPQKKPITIEDLMRQTSGITYGFYGEGAVRKAYGQAKIYDGDFDNAEFAERIAKLPLQEQPGTLWDYGHSTDILGRVIEVASGKSLLEFEKARLFGPLGMKDTNYNVPDAADFDRLAEPAEWDSDFKTGRLDAAKKGIKWQSGGGGLLTTLNDIKPFLQMMLDGGKLNGKTYLDPATFKEMTRDHVGKDSGIARDYLYFPGDGFGYGLGIAVRTDAGNAKPPPPGSLGELKWDGASGCYFVIDPNLDFYFVLLQQTPSERQRIQKAVKALIYEALLK
jgi:CubicO group peptidase (beta-lactamase class C family)